MKKAGCHTILFGAKWKSRCPRENGKDIDLEQVQQMVTLSRKLNIQTIASFIQVYRWITRHSSADHSICLCIGPNVCSISQARAFSPCGMARTWLGCNDWDEMPTGVNGLAYIPMDQPWAAGGIY